VRLVLIASLVSAIGYVLLPDLSTLSVLALPTMTVFRCLLAGCIAGLLVVRPNPWWATTAATAAGIGVGTIIVTLVTPVGVYVVPTILGLVLGCDVALLLALLVSSDHTIVAEALALVILIAVMLWSGGFLRGVPGTFGYERRQVMSAALQPEQYAFDGSIYLRTYELMKQGQDFYQAQRDAIIGDSRHDVSFITTPFNYREPFVFYLWHVLPGNSAATLMDWFAVFSVLVLVCSYVLASSLVARGVALLAPAAMTSWFCFIFWPGKWFAITEVWAAGFGVAAAMCLVRRWRVPSLVLLTAAVAAREFMAVLVPAWLAAWWWSGHRRTDWWLPAAAVAAPALVLSAHLLAVPATSGGGAGIAAWLQGGPARLIAAMRFGFALMPAGSWVSIFIGAAAIASAAVARPRWRMAALLAVTVLPTLFLLVFSGGEWHYYWGAFYMPLAVSVAPGAIGRLLPADIV
jgi:hypothetical protein